MQHKHICTAIAVAMTTIMSSCSDDFLENRPQGSLNDAVMNTTEGIDLLVNSAYAALGGPEGQDWSVWCTPTSNWSYGEVRSDNAYKGGGGVGDINEVHRMEIFDVEANNGNLDSKWYHLYCSVGRCNSALRALNQATDDQVANRQVRIAEMRFLRAHFFFELSRLFDKVPYFDENVATPDYVNIPNDAYTRDELLAKIADEMDAAAKALPATQPEIGRVNQYAAYAYLGKVLLYRAYKQDPANHHVTGVDANLLKQAITAFDKVINSGRYDLLPDFQDLDLIANENGRESVFAIQYSMNDGTKDAGRINWSNLLNSPGGNSPYHGDGFFLPSQDLINAYQTTEAGLPEFDYQTLPDYSQVNFVDEQNVTISHAEHAVDPRLDFVVGRPTITWKTWSDTPCMSWVRDRGTYGHNCIKRFWVSPESSDMFSGWPWGASGLNWQVIRYADVLLYKAEALIESNGDLNAARELINRVRSRAANSKRVADFNDRSHDAAHYVISTYPAAGWNQTTARQALRTEMRLEKAFEGERYFDLVRWGAASDVMGHYLDREAKGERIYYRGAKFTQGRDEYLPIPVNQYNFSAGLYTQNPGYPQF